MDDAELGPTTLRLEGCSMYTSPGGFNSGSTASLLSDEALELAMVITEQIALLSDAPGPIPTDMPLLFIHLTQHALSDLHVWLQTSYDWYEDISRLLAPNLSSEVLAWEIMGFPLQIEPAASSPLLTSINGQLSTPFMLQALPGPRGHVPRSLPVHRVTHAVPHEAPATRRHLVPKTNLSIIAYPNDELPSFEIITSPKVSTRQRRTRLVPKTDISIVVHPNTELLPIVVVSSPEVLPIPAPPVIPATPAKYLKDKTELNIGMAPYQSWNGGRKTRYGIYYGQEVAAGLDYSISTAL